MPTDIPLPGALAARLGLTRANLSTVELPGAQNQPPRLDAEKFFTLQAIAALMQSHPGLLLDHFVPFDRAAGWKFDSVRKGPWLRAFAGLANATYRHPEAAWRRWSQHHRELYPNGQGVFRQEISPRWRWVIGLGNQTILETGLTLHHTYAIPFIPGSALKGLTQALVMLNLEPAELTAELGPADSPEHQGMHNRLFGTQEQAGEVVFVGGVPSEPPRLVVDVMTPHFPTYYQGGRPDPLEVEDPTPIPFLVAAGGKYDLTLTSRRGGKAELLPLAARLVLAALDEMGIGGKTGKGYGYFLEG